MTDNSSSISLESRMGAVCTLKTDAGITGTSSRFHLYFEHDSLRTLCGMNLNNHIDMIDQGFQGILKDAKVSCKKCAKVLSKLQSGDSVD